MKPLRIVIILLVIGYLGVVPVVKHFVQKHTIRNEFDGVISQFNSVSREQFLKQLKEIFPRNYIDPADVEISIKDVDPDHLVVTIKYVSDFRVFLVPVHIPVSFSRQMVRLRM